MLILAKQFCQGWRCPPLSSKKVIITQFYSQVRKQKKLEQQVTIMPFKIVTNKLGNVKCIHFSGCTFYSRFFRMSPQRFDHLLTLVGPRIRKNDTNFREVIPPAESLAIALRFLPSGESQQSLAFLFCVWRSTISQIITETCDAIYASLSDSYLHPPRLANDWINISKEFSYLWKPLHAISAIDWKHVAIECLSKSGTFYNYKSFYSTVLLAICDEKYKYILFDIGQ